MDPARAAVLRVRRSTRTCRRPRWPGGTPLAVEEIVRASLNEKIETGQIDFVDDLANIVPACSPWHARGAAEALGHLVEPVHARSTPRPTRPTMARLQASRLAMRDDMMGQLSDIRANPRPGLIHALAQAEINGTVPPDFELLGIIALLIGAGSTPTTRADAQPWSGCQSTRSSGSGCRPSGPRCSTLRTEEFLRFYNPGSATGAPSPPTASSRASVQGGRADLAVVGDVQPRPRGVSPPQRGRPGPHRQPAPQLRPRPPPLHRVQRGPHGVQADVTAVLDRMPDYRPASSRAPSTTRRSASSRA